MLQDFLRDAPLDEIVAGLERDGGVIVHDFLAPERVDALVRDFEPHLDAEPWCNTPDQLGEAFFGRRTKRLHGLLARSACFADLVTHPLMLDLCARVLGPRCSGVRVSTGELMALGQGESDQLLHRDADSWIHFPRPRPEILLSCNVALTEFTEENGATVVAPGSHLWDDPARKPEPEELVKAVMPRGSALVYTGNVLHGGGANATPELRIGLYAGWLLSWLRPLENHLVTNGAEALQAAPAEARELLDVTETGWSVFP